MNAGYLYANNNKKKKQFFEVVYLTVEWGYSSIDLG